MRSGIRPTLPAPRRRPRSPLAAGLGVLLLAMVPIATARSGEVELANGLILEGTPVPIAGLSSTSLRPNKSPTTVYPMLMVDAGFKRYFFSASRRIVKRVDNSAVLSADVRFDLEHRRMKQIFAIDTLGPIADVQEFDRHGRRTVTINTPKGRKAIIQGIKRITPDEITVEGLNVVWEHGLATSSVEPAVLDPILRELIDPEKPNDRMSIALFYLQAQRFPECDRELEAIRTEFPELEGRVEEISLQLRQFWAQQLLDEIDQRRKAGQHRLAYNAAKQFPTRKMSASVLRRVEEIIAEYDAAVMKGHRVIDLLARFQSELDDDPRITMVSPMRSVVKRELDYESLPRLEPFLNLADDETLKPAEKLALAYSGWILGTENAITDLDATMRLWDARFLLGEFLRSEDAAYRAKTLESLLDIEGVDIPRLGQLIDELPPVLDASSVQPGVPARVVLREATETRREIAYQVLLPTEYNPKHRYPMIVALHPGESNATAALEWWGVVRRFKGDPPRPGQSQRRGYVVIAPEYLAPNEDYDHGSATHRLVTDAIRDARKRFRIDSDRVFLSGHGSGANAAFDIGMSRPDLFAGVIPIAGISQKYCQWYWPNAVHVPYFVVGGELDRDTPQQNSRDLTRMIKNYHDIIYCEYVGRGYESFFSEVHVLFDWMALHRREKYPRELELKVLRPTDNRFYWIESYGLPLKVQQANAALLSSSNRRLGIAPASLEARFTEANGLDIRRTGGDRHVIWLSSELADFEERFSIREKGRTKFNDLLEPSAETMLEDLRIRGDREKPYTVRIEID